MKSLICIILFLIVGIVCKKNIEYHEFIQSKVYEDSISFSEFKQFYNRYLGGIFPIENISDADTEYVFDEKLVYKNLISYEEGIALKVDYHYLVPNLEEGIVVYIGEKDQYGNVVMVENKDNVDIWYGNICNSLVKLYDNVKIGDYLGEACDDSIYLVYTKDNQYLDYRDYFN